MVLHFAVRLLFYKNCYYISVHIVVFLFFFQCAFSLKQKVLHDENDYAVIIVYLRVM